MAIKLKLIAHLLLPIVAGLIIAFFIRKYWFTVVHVDGKSMTPTLQNNERVIAVKTAQVHTGEIVIFKAYGVNPQEKDHNAVYVKRIIGKPGDTVRYTKAGQLYVNHHRIAQTYLKNHFQQTTGSLVTNDRHHLMGWSLTRLSTSQVAWKTALKHNRVPQGDYFVMGDHRSVSNDSRYWGFVPKSHIIGVVKAWPWQSNAALINQVN